MLNSITAKPSGQFHVEDYGAVALAFSAPHPGPGDALPTANVVAINTALAAVHAAGGGTLYFGTGVYFTNAAIGFDLHADTNVGVTVQGAGPFPSTLIFCLSTTEPAFRLHTRVANIRNIYLKDLSFIGGRQNLSLMLCWYCRFERLFFWGGQQFALQMQASNMNEFVECWWTETDAGGGPGDMIFAISSGAGFTACVFGESGGGIVTVDTTLSLTGGAIFQCWYKGSPYTDYWTTPGSPVDIDLSGNVWFNEKAAIVVGGQGLMLSNVRFAVQFLGIYLEYALQVTITGCQFSTGSDSPGDGKFRGFMKVWNYVANTALVVSGCTVLMRSVGTIGDSGYFITEPSHLLHNAIIDAQLVINPGASLAPLSSTAPALLNPHFENNRVNIQVFSSFRPDQLAAVTAWLRLDYGVITGTGYSSIPDQYIVNPAGQSVDARRPVNTVVNGLPAMTFSDASSKSLSWPLITSNNQTTKTGYACWVKQPLSGGPERIISIGGGTGGASGQKLFLAFDSSQRLTIGLYASDTGGRQGATSSAAFPANTPIFVRWAYDSSLGTEALRCKIYINGVLQTLTFSDIGVGGVPTTLRSVTGNALIGNFNDDPSSLQGLNGTIYGNFYCLNADLSLGDETLLMGYQSPV